MKIYYSILGVDENATPSQIKSAYRKLARKHHPDLNPNDQDATKTFQAINEANEVLSDQVKRRLYDQFGSDWKSFSKAGWSSGYDHYQNDSLRGFDHTRTIRLSILQAAKGHSRTVQVGGRDVQIKIPPGVEHECYLTYRGYGGLGRKGGPNGDLRIYIYIIDPRWKLVGKDVYSNEQVDLFITLLGGKILVETIDGPVKIKINPGTPNGTKIRISGKGFPNFKDVGPRGDFVAIIQVVLPCDLDPNEKKLFAKIAAKRNKMKTT
jgi:curved DNA-binding protein